MATDSFNLDNLVGEGTFGRVYRAQFNDRKVLAIKKLDSTVMPFQSSDDFAELVSNISKLHHPNLNELVGYCMEHGQHLLVYDFHGFTIYSTFLTSTASHLVGTLVSRSHLALLVH